MHLRAKRRFNRTLRVAPLVTIDMLESRRLMDTTGSETVQTPIRPVLADTTTPANNAITLNQHFFDATLPGTLVTFNTSFGTIQVGLTDAATPQTVANFLGYVESGAYNNSIFHRSSDLNTNANASPEDPGTIIQGGGFDVSNGSIGQITSNGNINDEYSTELYGNVAGTLAMAKTQYANSANSEWYFNVTANPALDVPSPDPNGVTTGYTVFGKVLSGTTVISSIASLPTDTNIGSLSGSPVPVANLSEADIQAGTAPTFNDLIYVNDATAVPGTSYTVSSDNKALVAPAVGNGVLSFTYGAGLFGVADITVTATNLDGTSAATTFAVTVPNPATPGAGPVVNPFTAPVVVTGNSTTFSAVGPDTDSVAALDPTTVAIVTQPANGTATVNSSNGFITYTPNAGFTGNDTLTYTIADVGGTTSAAGTVTLQAVPTAVTVSLKLGQSLVFTQPNGIKGHLSVTGGGADVTFTDYRVTTKLRGKTIFASGAGANITDITILNAIQFPNVSLTSSGPISISGINDAHDLYKLSAPTTTFTGNFSIGSVYQFTAASLNGAQMNVGTLDGGIFTNLTIANVINSDVNAAGNLGLVKSNKWSVTDGNHHTIFAQFINDLEVPGVFDEDLNLIYNRYGMAFCRVAHPNGTWNLAGDLVKGQLGTPGKNWSLSDGAIIQNLTFTGSLANNIIASAINRMMVDGKTSNSVIQTNGTFNAKFLQIASLNFKGGVDQSVIYAAGDIGSIRAPSLTNSRVYAGVVLAVAQQGSLPTASSNFSNAAVIGSISLGNGAKSFSDSLITAQTIISLHLGRVATVNKITDSTGAVSDVPFGIAAMTMGSLTATLTPGGVMHAGRKQLKDAASLAAYEKQAKLALGDFEVNLLAASAST